MLLALWLFACLLFGLCTLAQLIAFAALPTLLRARMAASANAQDE